MWLWTVLCLMMLLPNAVVTRPHRGTERDGQSYQSQEQIPTHPGTETQKEVMKRNLITMEVKDAKGGVGENKQKDAADTPHVVSHSFKGAPTVVGSSSSPPSLPQPVPGDVPCFGIPQDHQDALDDVLAALREGWNRESELGKEDLTRFGICTHVDGMANNQLLALSALAERAHKEKNGLQVLHPTKELWDVEEGDGGIGLTLDFPEPPQPPTHLTSLAPMMLLFFEGSVQTQELSITFSGHSLQPNKQTACVSEGTQFLVLTGRQTPSHSPGHLKLRITVETNKTENRPKMALSDLKGIMKREEAGHNVTTVLLLLDRGQDEEHGTPQQLRPSPGPLTTSSTFLFLCELQKFLNDVLPRKRPLPPPLAGATSVTLDALHSLPPLTLGVASSESLLLGLLNSSAPTVFSFPQRAAALQGHRGELELPPALLSLLRLRLEEALAQVSREEAGRSVMDRGGAGHSVLGRLQVLSELSALPREGDEQPAGLMIPRERQYRALLLLKALQMVLGAWEEERAQRPARAGTPCRLQSLTMSLEKYLLRPSTATINNCQGACGFPLTNGNNHVILLNSLVQGGLSLARAPCCVPVDYDDLLVVELNSEGATISTKPNMVAKECGCR